jgi:hypothetical protein
MISLSKRITAINLEQWARCLNTKDLIGGIRNKPLIENLEINSIFKDKAEEKGVSVTDLEILVVLVIRLLKQDFNRLVNGIELVEL